MLVLSRKKNESIIINNDIVITVVEIRGDKVRLGIVAPKDVAVHRQEVCEANHRHRPALAPTPGGAHTPYPKGRAEFARRSVPFAHRFTPVRPARAPPP